MSFLSALPYEWQIGWRYTRAGRAGRRNGFISFISFVSVIGISFVVTYLRLASNSVWPCVVLHASHNLFIQGVFDRLTADAGYTPFITTEFGIATAVVLALVGVIFWRSGRAMDSAKQLEPRR